jgi:hypothetical protein
VQKQEEQGSSFCGHMIRNRVPESEQQQNNGDNGKRMDWKFPSGIADNGALHVVAFLQASLALFIILNLNC